MYDQIKEDVLYIMLYAVVMAMAITASCYLLFRRGNAFATDVTTPLRLRRWTAAFFAAIALNHLWYLPILFDDSSEDIIIIDLTGGLLDSITLFPLALIVFLTMLQDRRRPLWPAFVMMLPIFAMGIWSVATNSYALLPATYAYCLLMGIGLITYMVRALRQYGKWLCDNYADLEHKEVWQSFLVLAVILLVFSVYMFTDKGPVYQYSMQVICLIIIFHLLWRVETLSDLSITNTQSLSAEEESTALENIENHALSPAVHNKIGELLQLHCIDTHLYLQHDLTIHQLAKAVGTNRLYLSQYFSQQGITYNAYINNLRISHFINLYSEAKAALQPFTAQQLAHQSGYRSYSTFGIAFKQRMGQTVTSWMRTNSE